jgi:DNA-binding response OmpR family regulator
MKNENYKVLIVDDNEDILFMLKAMLQYKNYEVEVKVSADGVEEMVEQWIPDLVIMDMLLSGTDGTEVCRKLKRNNKIAAVPVLMISALPQAAEKCLASGADYFIGKPFEMENLLETVSVAVSKTRQASL